MSAYIKKGLSAVRDGGTDALAKAKRAANRTDHPGVADQAEPSTEPVADSAKVAEEAAPGQPTGRARVRRRRAQDEVEDGAEANRASPPVPDAGNAAREEAELRHAPALLTQAATVDGGRRLGRWLQAVEPDLVRLPFALGTSFICFRPNIVSFSHYFSPKSRQSFIETREKRLGR